MIETTIKTALEALSLPVFLEEPEEPPAAYIVLRKTGSALVNRIREATVAVQSYGASLYHAAALNERVVDLMLGLGPADGVFSVELNSDYEYTNTETKQYRYQAVLEVYY